MRVEIERNRLRFETRFVVILSDFDASKIPELNLHLAEFFNLDVATKVRYLAYLAEHFFSEKVKQ